MNTNLNGGSFLPLNIPWLETSNITSLHLTEQESQSYKNYKWKQNSVESTQSQSTDFFTKLVQLLAVMSPSLQPPQDRSHPAVPRPGPDPAFPSSSLHQWWPRREAKFISAKEALPLLRRSLIHWVPVRCPRPRGPCAWLPLMLSYWWHNSTGSRTTEQASWVALVKNPPARAGAVRDAGAIPGLGRSPREGNDNPLQYSCLGNLMDRGAWQATVHGVAKSQTWMSMNTHTQYHLHVWEFYKTLKKGN